MQKSRSRVFGGLVLVVLIVAGVLMVHPETRGPSVNPLAKSLLSKEAQTADMRLRNLERSHPSSARVKSLRISFEQAPENVMLHDCIRLTAEFSDVLDFTEMSESDRKKLSLIKTALILPRAYQFTSAVTEFSRKWGVKHPLSP